MRPLHVTDLDPMAAPGVYDGKQHPRLPAEVYHSSARISRSDLVLLKLPNTPADFMYERGIVEPPSAAMVRGSALHTAILEPDLFEQQFALMPLDAKNAKKEDKQRIQDFLAENEAEGRQVVGWDYRRRQLALGEVQTLIEVPKRVREDPYIRRVLQGPGFTEVSVAWDVDGVGKRARIDRTYYGEDGPVVVDLKSVGQRGGAWGPTFARDMANRELQMQAGHYLEGMTESTGEEHRLWLFVAYECVPPYKVALHPLSDEAIEQGRRECVAATDLFRRCRDADEWPGYPRDFADVSLPKWKKEAS